MAQPTAHLITALTGAPNRCTAAIRIGVHQLFYSPPLVLPGAPSVSLSTRQSTVCGSGIRAGTLTGILWVAAFCPRFLLPEAEISPSRTIGRMAHSGA